VKYRDFLGIWADSLCSEKSKKGGIRFKRKSSLINKAINVYLTDICFISGS